MNFRVGQKVDVEKICQVMVSQPEQEVFQFVWKIKKFSLPYYSGKIKSPAFISPTGKTEWFVNIWEQQQLSGNTRQGGPTRRLFCIGLQLARTQSDFPVRAAYEYAFLNSEMLVWRSCCRGSWDFKNIGDLHEYPDPGLDPGNFMRYSSCSRERQTPCYLTSDDTINLCFHVTTTTPKHHEEELNFEKSQGLDSPMTSQASFKSFLDNGEFADITFSTKTKSFPASKIILAAHSPVFKAMFLSEMLESKENVVKIADFSDEAVKGFLEFLYTGKSKSLKENAVELFKMSDKYQVDPLKEECERILIENLNTETAADFLVLANFYNTPILKWKVTNFVKRFRKEVAQTDSFKQLKNVHPEILLDLYSTFDKNY